MTDKQRIKLLRGMNPYPVDVFPEPTYEDWHEIGKFLQEHGKNPDRIFANGWRYGYVSPTTSLSNYSKTL